MASCRVILTSPCGAAAAAWVVCRRRHSGGERGREGGAEEAVAVGGGQSLWGVPGRPVKEGGLTTIAWSKKQASERDRQLVGALFSSSFQCGKGCLLLRGRPPAAALLLPVTVDGWMAWSPCPPLSPPSCIPIIGLSVCLPACRCLSVVMIDRCWGSHAPGLLPFCLTDCSVPPIAPPPPPNPLPLAAQPPWPSRQTRHEHRPP